MGVQPGGAIGTSTRCPCGRLELAHSPEELRTCQLGTCARCGQDLIRTADDCWHPWNVERACPPEPPSTSPEYRTWLYAGNRSGRPGREHWRPAVGQ